MAGDIEKLRGKSLRNIEGVDTETGSDFGRGFDFSFGEEKAASFLTACCEGRFHLSREDTLFVSVSENVTENCFDVLLLVTTLSKNSATDGVGVDDLEEERAILFFTSNACAATNSMVCSCRLTTAYVAVEKGGVGEVTGLGWKGGRGKIGGRRVG